MLTKLEILNIIEIKEKNEKKFCEYIYIEC